MRFSMAGERKNALRTSQANPSSAARLEAQLMAQPAGSLQILVNDALAKAAVLSPKMEWKSTGELS
jgi:hypothetical protein